MGNDKTIKNNHDRRRIVHSIEARLNSQRSVRERFADWLVTWFGGFSFLVVNIIFFVFWIAINEGLIPGIVPFDPFPFILLTMAVSLEAIVLSIFVLISQNRESRISDLREEIDIQVNMISEQEITKIIDLLAYLMKYLKVPHENDPELRRMMEPLDTDQLRAELERQLNLSQPKQNKE